MSQVPAALRGPVLDWKERGDALPPGVIRVVLTDVDGVVTGGEGQPADLGVLQRLAAHNEAALHDPLVPAITLCTGRQAPYVELMAQMTGVFLPCIFEHGAGLFFPRAFLYAFHPLLGADYAARLAAVRAALDEPLLRSGHAFVQPGKEASMTLYPLNGTSLDRIADLAESTLAPFGGTFTLARNVAGVEVRPRGVDKGTGAAWLSEQVGIPLSQLAGVGDSDPDLVFLTRVAYAAAPANATPAVRSAAHVVAPHAHGEGLLEILDRIVRANRQRAAEAVA